MVAAKASRPKRRQLGQWMTPAPLAARIVDGLTLSPSSRVLEPSFGDGAFLLPLIRRMLPFHTGTPAERLAAVLTRNLFGVEIDTEMRATALTRIEAEFGTLPASHNLAAGDFFRTDYAHGYFDCIVGNPPYGGTFDPEIEDQLDRRYGFWAGHKLKKETYSFFIARSLDWLAPGGTLNFITSDTFLTINTMSGLRRKLMDLCAVTVEKLPSFSEETTQPTLVLHAVNSGPSDSLQIDTTPLARSVIALTGNFSWGIDASMARYFDGPKLGDFIVATSGMTVGRNELFLRTIENGAIEEPYDFQFFEDPITLAKELAKARLNKLSPTMRARIQQQESDGLTNRNVRAVPLPNGLQRVVLPHANYRYYNKANSRLLYSPPTAAIFWRDEGDAVLTFKKNGNWYLHGVGGGRYFGREGITWSLIAQRLTMRYLPAGYILDSGAPCAFLRPGVDASELWFILGWCLTTEASNILKTALNHTRNIQSKDVERMPYPYWVESAQKEAAIPLVEQAVRDAMNGRVFDRSSPVIGKLDALYAWELDN